MKPYIAGRAFIPMGLLDRGTVRKAQTSLLFEEQTIDRVSAAVLSGEVDSEDGVRGPALETVNEYRQRKHGVLLPRSWATTKFTDMDFEDRTVFPLHGIKLGAGPSPRDDQQRQFFESIVGFAKAPGPQDILANASTGVGKTVAGIYTGHQLKTRTLVIVDSNKIANGWLKNFRKFYGDEWTDRYVGRVQQDQCEWEGKAFSIALVQSLVRRDYGADFYRAFGCVLFDEVQVYGSSGYANALGMFPARVRVGFTAENRKGNFGKVIKAHLGDTRVKSKQAALQSIAYLIKNTIDQTFYCKSDGAILTGLSRLHDRNKKLAKLIKVRGYDRGRNVLVMSDRTAHLVELFNLCASLGIPKESMGLHMGSYVSHRIEIVYSYGGSALKLAVFETEQEARAVMRELRKAVYNIPMPAALLAKLKKDAKSVTFNFRKETYVPSQNELDNITNSCQIIFATKQIFAKGVDVPRLDMGVEALPIGNILQPIGRIRREYPGKPAPEWYAICDRVKLDSAFGNASDPSANLINYFLRSVSETRLNALKKAKIKTVNVSNAKK